MVKQVSDCPNPKVKSAGKLGQKFQLNLHLAIQQFITDHGIPMAFISDGDQAENFSVKWVQHCSKYKTMQSCLKPYKLNQNYVEC